MGFRPLQGVFKVDKIACLVGKNEAGKTAVLQALYRLNPIVEADGVFDVTNDYPRSDVENYQQEVESARRTQAVVITASLELEPEADIEDMFDEGFYLDLVNCEFTTALQAPLTPGTLTRHAPRTLVRVEDYFATTPLLGGIKFNHYRPARFFTENVSALTIPTATLDRFEEAFKAANALLPV